MTKKKVFIMTEGVYSAYHIEAVFSTKEVAEAACSTKEAADPSEFPSREIEEWPIDEDDEQC